MRKPFSPFGTSGNQQNALTRETHPDRMSTILDPDDYAQWLTGAPDEAFALVKPFPAETMVIHQSGESLKSDRGGLGEAR